uniref:CCHC-type domain-containing protein n=1 Tax=Fagus sylvatica TaxID=28930 RepID=A0A2N9G3W3_FAGSY
MIIGMEDSDMSDRPKEKERVRSSSDSGEHFGHSADDDGASHRSNKKHKERHPLAIPEVVSDAEHMPIGQPEVEPRSHVGTRKPSVSYKESLIGVIPGAYESAFFGSSMEEDGGDISYKEEDVPPEDGEVVIKFPRELKQKIKAPWCTSLIVKVFGRSVGYVFLVNKLKIMWKSSGNFSCVDLGLGFFLIRFETKEGFEEVLKGGPWFIGEHFLSLRPWVPNFRASEASVSSIAVWVRLPELPVEYYHKDSLFQIGSGLGPVLRVDINIAARTRVRFVRLCIQLDIDKPLTRTVRVGKTRLAVIYEGVSLLCFHCGKIGHRREWCPTRTPEETEIPVANEQSKLEEEDKPKGFGPWMIVSRRKRQTKPAVLRDDRVLDRAAGPSAVQGHDSTRQDGLAGTSEGQARDKTRAGFRYSTLDKGKSKHAGGAGNSSFHGPSNSEHLNAVNSLQSQSFNQNTQTNDKPISFSSPPQQPLVSSSEISLHPHLPKSKSGNDKHSMGGVSAVQSISKLEDSAGRSVHLDRRRCDGTDSKGSTSCVGLVRRRDSSSMVRNSSSSPKRRSTSPNRHGLVARDKPILELPNGHPENRWDSLSTKSSLSAIAEAEICPISGGGVLRNIARIRREEELRGKGFLEYQFTSTVIRNNMWEMWPEKAWNSLEAEGTLFPPNNPPFMSSSEIGVNILTWNCRGVLNPCFHKALLDTLQINNPEILILTKTRLGGDRAVELARSFPFDGFLCTNTIGFAGGIWILWKTKAVELNKKSMLQILWENLKIIAGLNNLPWVMLGDFNEILLCEEKWGGLDRVLANPDWRILCPEASVTHLTRTHSDHCAVLLSLCPSIPCILPRPFRFESIWKKRILARLNGVQCALTSRPSESLYKIEKSFREDYFVILKLEEELWALKSRVGWAFKAPGPDGLHPGFFQKCWSTVGDSVVKEVRQIFSTGRMPEYLNRTLIALIPKCLGPETLSQFRPISLCNTVYKIEGFSRLDNVVIAQELIHYIHRKKGRMGQLILKLDLEKAYDRLEWDFIREVLTFFKFPPSFVDLVLECVSTSSFSILVNGGQLDNFKPSRGIRQGNPLSPYLFILCMEYLSLKILEACDNNSWKAIKASRTGPSFSHLFFADDLLLCTEASSNCCHTITRILEDFYLQSGQKVSLSKSKVFFSPNVNTLRQHLCGILGVSSTPNLGKYLGFPLRSNGRSTRDFDFVVEKVQAKLSSWKAKLLSPVGRVILVQSVTSAIPTYYMQNVALPIRVCFNLDKLNKDFLWGSIDERKKMHMVSWDKICRPRDLGGLGLYSTKARNLALLAKLNWRVMEDPNSLWAKTLIAKYYPNGIMDERLGTHRSGSSNWKGMKNGHEVFRKGLRWVVSNGQEISFWHDLWVGDRPLRSLVHGPLSSWEDSLRVCDVVEGVSMWNLSTLSLDIPTCTRESIKAISVCPNRPLADKRVWDSVGGEFKLGKAYSIAYNKFSECSSLNPSSWIWKVRTSPRIMFFLWQCYHLSVPVREILASHGINIPTFCPRCLAPNESLIHMLRDCPDSIAFWSSFRFPSLVAVELVNSITSPNAFLSTIVTDCRSLMERFESCSLKHIFREANGYTDLLAKTGCDQRPDFISFSNAPAHVLEALAFDISSTTRFCLISS